MYVNSFCYRTHSSRYILTWLPELRPVAETSDRLNVLEPWRLAPGYRRKQEIDVTPARDSPLWIMSVNRVNWPEYQKMMTGRAYTVTYKPHSPHCLHRELCQYPPPTVPPVELEIRPEKIPVDNSWGSIDKNSSRKGTHQRRNAGAVVPSDAQLVKNSVSATMPGRTPKNYGSTDTVATPGAPTTPQASQSERQGDNASKHKTSTRGRGRKHKPRRKGGRVQSGPLGDERSASRQTHLSECVNTSVSLQVPQPTQVESPNQQVSRVYK